MAIALTLITLAFGPVVGRNPHSLHDRDHGPSLGTDGSNPALSSGDSANFWFLGDRLASGVPKIRELYEATYFAGLRKAGMPEE